MEEKVMAYGIWQMCIPSDGAGRDGINDGKSKGSSMCRGLISGSCLGCSNAL